MERAFAAIALGLGLLAGAYAQDSGIIYGDERAAAPHALHA